jgi:hypothetical protein
LKNIPKSGKAYQNVEKYTKRPQNVPIGDKWAIKISNASKCHAYFRTGHGIKMSNFCKAGVGFVYLA